MFLYERGLNLTSPNGAPARKLRHYPSKAWCFVFLSMIAHNPVIVVISTSLRGTLYFAQPDDKSWFSVGVKRGSQKNIWSLYITLVLHLIHGKAIVLFHTPHLHLRAPLIMISFSLAHVQLVNLFALDQRKFPRGCSPPSLLESQPYLLVSPRLFVSMSVN